MDTYVCYVDFSRAFDNINHTLLIRKLFNMNINSTFCQMIKGIYSSMYAAVCGFQCKCDNPENTCASGLH